MEDAREGLPTGLIQKNKKKLLDHLVWVPTRNF